MQQLNPAQKKHEKEILEWLTAEVLPICESFSRSRKTNLALTHQQISAIEIFRNRLAREKGQVKLKIVEDIAALDAIIAQPDALTRQQAQEFAELFARFETRRAVYQRRSKGGREAILKLIEKGEGGNIIRARKQNLAKARKVIESDTKKLKDRAESGAKARWSKQTEDKADGKE